MQQNDGNAQTPQEQASGTSQTPVVQLQLPQDQLNLAHLMQNAGHGTLPLPLTLTPQQMQLLASK